MLSYSPEQRVPANHRLYCIKAYTDSALKQIRLVLGGLGGPRLRGVGHNRQLMCLAGLAYNLVRINRIGPTAGYACSSSSEVVQTCKSKTNETIDGLPLPRHRSERESTDLQKCTRSSKHRLF